MKQSGPEPDGHREHRRPVLARTCDARSKAARAAKTPPLALFEDVVAARLQGRTAIRIARAGSLGEAQAGHPPGTPYLVIQAGDAMNRGIARNLLRDCSSTTDLAWDYGWTPRHLPNGERVTELPLYPAAFLLRRAA